MASKIWKIAKKTVYVVALTVGIAVCALFVLKTVVRTGTRILSKASANVSPKPSDMAMFRNQPFMRDTYWREETASARVNWAPWILWRRPAFTGETINVDENGVRATWRPDGVPPGATKKTVWMFGGSTMWGSGAVDWETIPSQLNKALFAAGVYAEVINFGETGFVTSQELVFLLRLLSERERPDLVIFYDGFNDVFTSYQQRLPGLSSNEHNRRFDFEITRARPGVKARETFYFLFARLKPVVERFQTGLGRIMGYETKPDGTYTPINHGAYPLTDEERDRLAQGTVDYYSANLDHAKTICESRGIAFLGYWQPWILHKNTRTRDEERIFDSLDLLLPGLKEFALVVEDKLAKDAIATRPGFKNLSNAFADDGTEHFYDWVHIDGQGNRVVAELMAKDAKEVLNQEKP